MQRDTITGTITHTVFVSQTGTAQSPLTITATGDIAPRRYGADGVVVLSSVPDASITNAGLISGGFANAGTLGGIGVDFRAAGILMNTGTIEGGSTGPTYAGTGGTGIQLDAATLLNAGAVAGGNGEYGYKTSGFDGGIGVMISDGASLSSNSGTITGGHGGYGYRGGGVGGAGVMLSAAMLSNTGTISAGASGGSYSGTAAGTAGVIMQDNAVLENAGDIAGGVGGTGGAGVYMAGGTLTNTGTITGGKPALKGGLGGPGVILDGGTLTNAGTIGAGASPASTDAIQFGAKAATLILDPGAVFNGLVAGDAGAGDQLRLAGTTAGTLSGLGGVFTGFAGLAVDTAASWALGGVNALGGGSLTMGAGSLVVDGTLTGTGHADVAAGGTLGVTGDGALTIGKLLLAGGTLDGSGAGTILIGGQGTAMAGAITVADGAGIHGSGIIAGGAVIDDGAIVADGGTLTATGALEGDGVAIIQGATLDTQGAVSVANLNFQGPATLSADAPTAITSTINGFGTGDVIDLQHLVATTLSFLNGTLSLDDGGTTAATLHFNGSFETSSFALEGDGHGGVDVLYAGGPDLPWLTAGPDVHSGAAREPGLGAWTAGAGTALPWVAAVLDRFGSA